MREINQELINDINKALDKGLTAGKGIPVEGELCVEALICLKLGLLHSDNPPCVGLTFRRAKIRLNDRAWSSNMARANGMRKLAVAQLGSDKLDQKEASDRLVLGSTKRVLPYLIQTHYTYVNDERLMAYKAKFENLTEFDMGLWTEFYVLYNGMYGLDAGFYDSHYMHTIQDYDKFLLLMADVILQVLIDMKCEGCQWL